MGNSVPRASDAGSRILELCGRAEAETFKVWLQTTDSWPGQNAVARKIARCRDREALRDLMAEVRFALIFRGIGFQVRFEPLGSVGPDLEVTRADMSITVEVTRVRPTNPGPQPFDGTGGLLPYGNFERDVRRTIRKITSKIRQARGPLAGIAIWNDDEALEHVEARFGTRALRRRIPVSIQFILYGSNWVRTVTHQQLYCFPLQDPLDERLGAVIQDLESTTVRQAVGWLSDW